MPKTKQSTLEKEKKLQAKIAKMQQALDKLKAKRRQQLAAILEKHGLDKLENHQLEKMIVAAITAQNSQEQIPPTLSLPSKSKLP